MDPLCDLRIDVKLTWSCGTVFVTLSVVALESAGVVVCIFTNCDTVGSSCFFVSPTSATPNSDRRFGASVKIDEVFCVCVVADSSSVDVGKISDCTVDVNDSNDVTVSAGNSVAFIDSVFVGASFEVDATAKWFVVADDDVDRKGIVTGTSDVAVDVSVCDSIDILSVHVDADVGHGISFGALVDTGKVVDSVSVDMLGINSSDESTDCVLVGALLARTVDWIVSSSNVVVFDGFFIVGSAVVLKKSAKCASVIANVSINSSNVVAFGVTVPEVVSDETVDCVCIACVSADVLICWFVISDDSEKDTNLNDVTASKLVSDEVED